VGQTGGVKSGRTWAKGLGERKESGDCQNLDQGKPKPLVEQNLGGGGAVGRP